MATTSVFVATASTAPFDKVARSRDARGSLAGHFAEVRVQVHERVQHTRHRHNLID